jgi:hypothetical protein
MLRFLRSLLNLIFNRRGAQARQPVTGSETGFIMTGGLAERSEHVFMDDGGEELTLYAEDKSTRKRPDGQVVRLTRKEIWTCDFGHVLGQGNNVAGRCAICSGIICEKCASTCSYCGRAVCLNHAFEIGGKTYCVEHRFIGLSRKFLGV